MLPYRAALSIAVLIGETLAIAFVAGEGRDRQRSAHRSVEEAYAEILINLLQRCPSICLAVPTS